MRRITIGIALASITLGGLAVCAAAAEPALGIITANGAFRLNRSTVNGNATLFDGAVIETTKIPSRLKLNNGARIGLSAASKAKVHRSRLVLETGMSEVSSLGRYEVEAGGFRIAAATRDGAGRIARKGPKAVQVAALRGALRVYDAKGLLLANVAPGTALEFEPQESGPTPPSSFLGCVLKKDGKFILYDQTTRIIVELRGSGFQEEWGNRIQVIGTTDTTARSKVGAQVLDVTSATRFGKGGCGPVASAINAQLPPGQATPAPQPAQQPPAPAAAKAPPAPAPSAPAPSGGGGMSAGTKIAIIAAVGGGGAAAAVLATQSGNDRSRD